MMATVLTSSLVSLIGFLTKENMLKSYYKYGNKPRSNAFHSHSSPIFNFIRTVFSNFVLQNVDDVIVLKHIEVFGSALTIYGHLLDCLSCIQETKVKIDGFSNGFEVFYSNFLRLEIEAFLATLD